MHIKPKSVTSTNAPVTKQPQQKNPPIAKKIDMGAAANFGKQSAVSNAGIHSPTHRDTPGESGNSDLIGYSPINNNLTQSSNTTNHNNNNVDDLFKTCSPKSEKTLNSAAIVQDDFDDFNPRANEPASNEFGDFSAAFGSSGSTAVTAEIPLASLNVAGGSDDFADFTAFQGSVTTSNNTVGGLDSNLLATTATPANDSFDLFSSVPAATSISSNSMGATTATDLLAGLGDLSIHQSMPMGKSINWKNYLFLLI